MNFKSNDMVRAHIAAPFNDLRHSVAARRAKALEVEALRQAGRELAGSGVTAAHDRLQPHFAILRSHRIRQDLLSSALGNSLQADRADYVQVSPWFRPLVVLRGACDRAVLQHQLRGCRRELDLCHEALGRAARASSVDGVGLAGQARRINTGDGAKRPPWPGVLAQEGHALGVALWQQLHGRLVPRASALAGLAAGWWIASTYTDSHLRSMVNAIGIGRGGTHVVSGTTYRAMGFWIPLLAAAMCAYLGDRLARAFKYRYQPAASESVVQGQRH